MLLAVFADGLTYAEHVRFVKADFEGGSAMSRRTEGDSLRRHRRIRPLAVIRRDQPRNIHQRGRRAPLAREGIDPRTQVVARAALLSLMRCMSSIHDLTNDAAPSTCSCSARALTLMPARAKRASISSASPPSFAMTPFSLPLCANANKVFSGMVSTVSGAASASTYRPGGDFGSFVPVLAHSMRCLRAPLASRSFQRLPAIKSQCAL